MKIRLRFCRNFLAVCLGLFVTNAYAVSVGGIKGGSHENTNFESLGDNDVGGTAASGWSFQSATASPAEYKDASCTSSTTGTFTKSGKTFNFVSFTVTVSGIILPSGPGNGPCPTDYTISASRQNPGFNIEPPEAVIKAGDSCTFTAKESMSVSGVVVYGNKNSNWTISSNGNTSDIVQNTSSVNVGSAWWEFFYKYYNISTPAPGAYIITATTSVDSEPVSAQANLNVIGVASITATPTGGIAATSTTNDSYAAPIAFCAVGGELKVKATPNIGSVWPSGTPVWTTAGDEWLSDRVGGVGEEKNVITSNVEDGFVVIATCGTSQKCINIVILPLYLNLTNNSLILKHNSNCNLTLTASETTANGTIVYSKCKIEISRNTLIKSWHTLFDGMQTVQPWHATIAGKFVMRIKCEDYTSPTQEVTVEFPTYYQIVIDASVVSRMNTEWENTTEYYSSYQMQMERAFWITLDTGNDSYNCLETITGDPVPPTEPASVNPGTRPGVNLSEPAPNASSAIYAVAVFHTHPPILYAWGKQRTTGPSDEDNAFSVSRNIAGIVWDYTASTIYGWPSSEATPIDAPANAYPTDFDQRNLDNE